MTSSIPTFDCKILTQNKNSIYSSEGTALYKVNFNGKAVAIKVIFKDEVSSDERNEFCNAMNKVYQMNSPFLVRVIAASWKHSLGIAYEYMSRGSLWSSLRAKSITPWAMRWKILYDASSGLEYLHKKDVVHYSLSSHTILLNRNGQAKITNYGVRLLNANRSKRLIQYGKEIDLSKWMPPEQLDSSQEMSSNVDIYSFGVILWELVTQEVPLKKYKNIREIAETILRGHRDPIPNYCPKNIALLITNCWAIKPSSRPAASEIHRKLWGENPQKISLSLTNQKLIHKARSKHKLNTTDVDPETIYLTGYKYDKGIGVEQSHKIAYQYFKKAADLNHLKSIFCVAYCLELGRGVPKNEELALKFYQTAADRGHQKSLYNLGCIYEEGVIVPQEQKLANEYFRRSGINQE